MRYLIQFLVPVLVVIVVTLIVLRGRARAPGDEHDTSQDPLFTGAFILILIIGATFTVAVMFAVEAWLD